ncbi:MAG: hypothetical protein WC969_13340 [Elusimicrobiota bacterium]|jgi:hypothetical protein
MKKWIIPAAVVVLGGLLAYRAIERRRAAAPETAPVQPAVPLTPAAQTPPPGAPETPTTAPASPNAQSLPTVEPQTMVQPPTPSVASGPDPAKQAGPKVGKIVEDANVPKGPCADGSLESILRDQGRTWGRSVNRKLVRALPSDLSDGVADRITGLQICRALAARNPSTCLQLSGERTLIDGALTPLDETPQGQCMRHYLSLMFAGGEGAGEKTVCVNFYAGFGDALPIPAEEVCEPSRNPLNLCAYIAQRARAKGAPFGAKEARECSDRIPSETAHCGGSKDCEWSVRVLKAFSAKSAAGLSADDRPFWEAFRTRGADACAPLQKSLESYYCRAREDYNKKMNGYIGMTDDDVKAAEEHRKQEFLKLEQYHKQRRSSKPKHFE